MLPCWPTTDEMFTIRPEPRSSMCSRAGLDMKNAPDRFTWMTLFQSSSLILRTGRSAVMPALLTRMSRRPCCSMTSWTERRQSSGEETLPWWIEPLVPASSISLQKVSAFSRLPAYPAATTAPCDARLRQIARPIPRVPPVTKATRPVSFFPAASISAARFVAMLMLRSSPRASRRSPAISPCVPWPPPSGRYGRPGGPGA